MKSILSCRRLSIESLEARELLALLYVQNTNDMGSGSLRAAIDAANMFSDDDAILFSHSDLGSGQHVISLNSPLPKIVAGVTISGDTAIGYAGTPLVQIRPSVTFGAMGRGLLIGTGPLGSGQTFTGLGIVRALSITGFPEGRIRVEANADLRAAKQQGDVGRVEGELGELQSQLLELDAKYQQELEDLRTSIDSVAGSIPMRSGR